MIIARHAISNPNKTEERAQFFEEHKAYLRNASIRILLSGPSAPPVEGQKAAALIIAKVNTLDEFKSFSDGDPFVRSGVYEAVNIFEWRPTTGALLDNISAD